MDYMVNLEWHEFTALTAGLIAIGGVAVGLMRGFFQTKKECESHQANCQKAICVKIDKLRDSVASDRQVVQDHYVEIKEALGRIHGKLNGWRNIEKRQQGRGSNGN